MRSLPFVLILFLTACNLAEQADIEPEIVIEAVPETVTGEEQSASARGVVAISAAIVGNYQLTGQSDDFAGIEFTIAPGQTLPTEITFGLDVSSNYYFEGTFRMSNANWSIESMEPVEEGTNTFNCTIVHNTPYPLGFVIEDIICLLPDGCGDCVGLPPSECVSFTLTPGGL